MSDSPSDAFTPAELDDIARNLSSTEELWESAQRETTVTVSCPECGGAGNTDQGTLGSGCWACSGTGTVVDEFAEAPLLELPAPLRTLRLQYKTVRGLLDAHNAGVIARDNIVTMNEEFPDEVPVAVPVVPPAPTRADAADLVAGMAKIEEIRTAAKQSVQKQRRENAALGAGDGTEVSRLKKALASAKSKIKSLGGMALGGGSLGGGGAAKRVSGDDLEDDDVEG